MMIYTNHAEQRMQQRAIPELAIELLEIYGSTEHSNGARIRFFDKKARQQVTHAVKALASDLDRIVEMYLVEGNDGVVITAGHRTRSIKRDFKTGPRKAKNRS
jgi:hypothetical protein